jgi:hypothetical protein
MFARLSSMTNMARTRRTPLSIWVTEGEFDRVELSDSLWGGSNDPDKEIGRAAVIGRGCHTHATITRRSNKEDGDERFSSPPAVHRLNLAANVDGAGLVERRRFTKLARRRIELDASQLFPAF